MRSTTGRAEGTSGGGGGTSASGAAPRPGGGTSGNCQAPLCRSTCFSDHQECQLARRGLPCATPSTAGFSRVPPSRWCLCKGTPPSHDELQASTEGRRRRYSLPATCWLPPHYFPIRNGYMRPIEARELCSFGPHGDNFRRCRNTPQIGSPFLLSPGRGA